MIEELPNPAEEDLKNPIFNAIYNVIKTWDISTDDKLYCHATGSHAKMILDAVKEVKCQRDS